MQMTQASEEGATTIFIILQMAEQSNREIDPIQSRVQARKGVVKGLVFETSLKRCRDFNKEEVGEGSPHKETGKHTAKIKDRWSGCTAASVGMEVSSEKNS